MNAQWGSLNQTSNQPCSWLSCVHRRPAPMMPKWRVTAHNFCFIEIILTGILETEAAVCLTMEIRDASMTRTQKNWITGLTFISYRESFTTFPICKNVLTNLIMRSWWFWLCWPGTQTTCVTVQGTLTYYDNAPSPAKRGKHGISQWETINCTIIYTNTLLSMKVQHKSKQFKIR